MPPAGSALDSPVRQAALLVPSMGGRHGWRACQAARRARNLVAAGTTLRNRSQGGKSLPEVPMHWPSWVSPESFRNSSSLRPGELLGAELQKRKLKEVFLKITSP